MRVLVCVLQKGKRGESSTGQEPLCIRFPRGSKMLYVSFSSTTVGELISEIQGLLLTDVHWQVLVQGVGAAPNALRCLLFCGKSYRPGGTGTEKLLSQINMHRECTADVYLTIMPFSEPPAAEAEGVAARVEGGDARGASQSEQGDVQVQVKPGDR